jgi:hypothetical protein
MYTDIDTGKEEEETREVLRGDTYKTAGSDITIIYEIFSKPVQYAVQKHFTSIEHELLDSVAIYPGEYKTVFNLKN